MVKEGICGGVFISLIKGKEHGMTDKQAGLSGNE